MGRSSWLVVLVLLGVGCAEPDLTFERGDETLGEFDVRFAITAEERRQGLQGSSLDAHQALVIWPPAESELCITNARVAFAIDAIYVSDADAVIEVRSFAADEETLHCVPEVRYVVEVSLGAVDVEPGDRVRLYERPM